MLADVAVGSFVSDRYAGGGCEMSALPPIATELMQRRELTRSATSVRASGDDRVASHSVAGDPERGECVEHRAAQGAHNLRDQPDDFPAFRSSSFSSSARIAAVRHRVRFMRLPHLLSSSQRMDPMAACRSACG
jgi:hypothetical protein